MHLIYIFSRQILNLKTEAEAVNFVSNSKAYYHRSIQNEPKIMGKSPRPTGTYCEIYCDHFDLIPFRSCMPLYKQIEGWKHQKICLNSTEYTQVTWKQQFGDKAEIFFEWRKKKTLGHSISQKTTQALNTQVRGP